MSSKFLNIDKPWLNSLQKNNNIPVVSGKWQRPRPYHQRLCEECELLGDEYHFLFVCKRLKALRSKYISRYFWTKPSMNKFIELLSSEHSKTINILAIFVYSGLEVFANLWKKKKKKKNCHYLQMFLIIVSKYHPVSLLIHRTYCIYFTILCFCTQADGLMLRWNKRSIYLSISETIDNGCWRVCSGEIGHHRSYIKVTT